MYLNIKWISSMRSKYECGGGSWGDILGTYWTFACRGESCQMFYRSAIPRNMDMLLGNA